MPMAKQSNLWCMDMFKKFLLLAVAVLASASASGQVTWYLQTGGIWGSGEMNNESSYFAGDHSIMHEDYWNESYRQDIKSGYEVAAGLYMQIPVKANRMFIDTGLGWRMKNVVSLRDFYVPEDPKYAEYGNYKILNYQGRMNFLELPVRFGYQLNLNEKNSFQFKLGPYVSYALGTVYKNTPDYFGDTPIEPKQSLSPLSVGLSPSVMYKHRAFSVGATLNTPCFYNGLHSVKSTSFNLVIAVHLGSTSGWNLDAIADGLDAASQVMGTVSDTYMQMQMQSDSGDSNYGSSSSDNYNSNYSKSGDDSKGFSLSEQQSYNTDKSTYERYDSQLASHFAGNQTMSDSSVRQAQNKMKQLRKKWERKGRNFPHSQNEDR